MFYTELANNRVRHNDNPVIATNKHKAKDGDRKSDKKINYISLQGYLSFQVYFTTKFATKFTFKTF